MSEDRSESLAKKCVGCTPEQKTKCTAWTKESFASLFHCGGEGTKCAVFHGQAGIVWNLLLFPIMLPLAFHKIYCTPFLSTVCGRLFRSVLCICCAKDPKCAKMCCQDSFIDHDFTQSDAIGATPAAGTKWLRIDSLAKDAPIESGGDVEKAAAGVGDDKDKKQHAEMVLFDGEIEPCDLLQGALGDCWLIAALATAAEHPASIRSRFSTLEKSFRGRYVIQLFYDGEWRNIEVDDYIPMKESYDGSFSTIYAEANGNEMWTILFEKAFAKMFTLYGHPSNHPEKGYLSLKGGHMEWVYSALTGNKGGHFDVDREACEKANADEEDDAEHPFDKICRLASQKSLMGVVWGFGKKIEQQEDNGLVLGHAYSVLDGRRCVLGGTAGSTANLADGGDDDNEVLLVKCRNPWGKHEWNGRWSDRSGEWQRHPNVAKMLDFSEVDDGIFCAYIFSVFSRIFSLAFLFPLSLSLSLSLAPAPLSLSRSSLPSLLIEPDHDKGALSLTFFSLPPLPPHNADMEWHDFSNLAKGGVTYSERDAGVRDLCLDLHEDRSALGTCPGKCKHECGPFRGLLWGFTEFYLLWKGPQALYCPKRGIFWVIGRMLRMLGILLNALVAIGALGLVGLLLYFNIAASFKSNFFIIGFVLAIALVAIAVTEVCILWFFKFSITHTHRREHLENVSESACMTYCNSCSQKACASCPGGRVCGWNRCQCAYLAIFSTCLLVEQAMMITLFIPAGREAVLARLSENHATFWEPRTNGVAIYYAVLSFLEAAWIVPLFCTLVHRRIMFVRGRYDAYHTA